VVKKVVPSHNRIRVEWDPVPDATGYRVYYVLRYGQQPRAGGLVWDYGD
jgi:hypothetical protein